MNQTKKIMIGLLIAVSFAAGFLLTFHIQRHRIPFGNRYIELNPKAVPSPEKTYHLRLWDYNWPAGQGTNSYQKYLEQAVGQFQKSFPNIKVEIRLLDLLTGPAILSGALQNNTAPDVYCSAFAIPPFDPGRQIPAGVFLTPEEIGDYFHSVQAMVRLNGYLCYLPRWTAPGFWIGNRTLLEKSGVSVAQIRSRGWCWTDLAILSKRLKGNRTLLASNPASNGFFRQLVAGSGQDPQSDVPIWNGQGVGAALDFLGQLTAGKKWTPVISPDCAARFLSGKALILAGVRPVFFPLAKRKLASPPISVNVTFLPIPGRYTNRPVILTENSVIAVYRNTRTSGDDHLAAAVKLARFLSCYQNTAPWEKMMVVPASRTAAAQWSQNTAPLVGADESAYLIEKLQNGKLQNLPEFPEYHAKVYPALLDFLAGKTTATQAQVLMFDR